MISLLADELCDWVEALAGAIPGRIGSSVRAALNRVCVGRNAHLGPGLSITGRDNVSIGDDFAAVGNNAIHAHRGGSVVIGNRVALNRNVIIDAAEGGAIELGDDVIIGPNSVLRASNHAHLRVDVPIRQQGHEAGRILVENGVWLAANVVVLPGVRVGAHSIVAAGAVVTRDVPPYSVAAGAPARVIRDRRAGDVTAP